MFNLFSEISLNETIFLCINFTLILILFLMNLATRSNYKKLKAKYSRFMNGLSDRNLEDLLDSHIQMVNQVIAKNREIENHINSIDRNLLQCMQKIGVVRFNAFDNVGSDLSFSVALLDNNENGVVISGIYARDSSSTYAKPIIGGKSRYALSAEEIQALEIAKKSHREALYTSKVENV